MGYPFYVETYEPPDTTAGARQNFLTFDQMMEWLDPHLRENRRRIGRLLTTALLTEDQKDRLARYRIDYM